MKKYKYLFGPVPSRRLGRSLGIDLLINKTCCLDCIFCQLGRTKEKTVIRKEYVPVDEVLDEIKDWLATKGEADYITLSGSGEPTLHSGFGRVLAFLKEITIPSVLLTNGTMFSIPEVREAASYADIVKVSLSVWDQHSFHLVNRPHEQMQFQQFMDGLMDFRSQFNGEMWLEVFLLYGINSMPKDVEKIAAYAKKIQPDRIQLNTVTRPPAEDFAEALLQNQMVDLAGLFEPAAEVIKEFNSTNCSHHKVTEDNILDMLKRRPCTNVHIATVFGLHTHEVAKYLGKLLHENLIFTVHRKTEVYYTVRDMNK
jgi:wyosine [tRNA(Phe)-imidazoG37] synthetase (radical SAM superfamily)